MKHSLPIDQIAENTTRYFLILQAASLALLIVLTITGLNLFAILIAIINLVIFACVLLLLYVRFIGNPLVKEKLAIQKQVTILRTQIKEQENKIKLSKQTRDRFIQDEKSEKEKTLSKIQEGFIQTGLKDALISEAQISGIGPKLKERLISHGIVAAININQTSISGIDGFGAAKSKAVLDWRNNVYLKLDANKPKSLPSNKDDEITNKFKLKHNSNDEVEQKAQDIKVGVEEKLTDYLTKLDPFKDITFRLYLLNSISSKGSLSVAVVSISIIIIVCMGISGVLGSIALFTPKQTSIPTLDVREIQTSAVQTVLANSSLLIQSETSTPTFISIITQIQPSPTLFSIPTLTIVYSSPTSLAIGVCNPGDQLPYVYSPDRLKVLADCIHVTGTVDDIRNEPDGDLHILLKLDQPFIYLLKPANSNEKSDLVVEPVCVHTPTQADAIEPCSNDPDPINNFPRIGQHIWMEGRYVTDSDHGGWAEIHPLGAWGDIGTTPNQPPAIIPANTSVKVPTAIKGARVRIGAVCVDGSSSTATGGGACSRHGGVSCWNYSDGSCTKP